MDETNEIPALSVLARRKYEEEGSDWDDVARAVREAVLASLQARSGMFGAEDMRQALNAVDVLAPLHGHALRKQFAAQGATIAALQQRAEQAERERDEARRTADVHRKDAVSLHHERIAAESALATLRDEVDGLTLEARHQREARDAAESALATLRQALTFIAAWDYDSFPRVPDRDDPTRTLSYGYAYGSNGERDYMRTVARKALAAASAPEHPDTATHRAPCLYSEFRRGTCMLPVGHAGAHALGDSGPSGGGETRAKHACGWNGDPCLPGACPAYEPYATPPGLAACVSVEAEQETMRTHVKRAKAALADDAHRRHCTADRCKYGDAGCPMVETADICPHGSLKPCGMCEPTEADDWAMVENALNVLAQFGPDWSREADDAARAAISRLKQARVDCIPKARAGEVMLARVVEREARSAEEMRERCAELIRSDTADDHPASVDRARFNSLEQRIRALPLKP